MTLAHAAAAASPALLQPLPTASPPPCNQQLAQRGFRLPAKRHDGFILGWARALRPEASRGEGWGGVALGYVHHGLGENNGDKIANFTKIKSFHGGGSDSKKRRRSNNLIASDSPVDHSQQRAELLLKIPPVKTALTAFAQHATASGMAPSTR